LGLVGDPATMQFGDAMISALGDRSLRERVASAGNELVSRTYDPLAIGKQLEAMYLDALQERKRTKR
jgi:hypothetical protein